MNLKILKIETIWGGRGVWEENNMNPKYKIWHYWFLEEIIWNQNAKFWHKRVTNIKIQNNECVKEKWKEPFLMKIWEQLSLSQWCWDIVVGNKKK
jgi:hypothetical protein